MELTAAWYIFCQLGGLSAWWIVIPRLPPGTELEEEEQTLNIEQTYNQSTGVLSSCLGEVGRKESVEVVGGGETLHTFPFPVRR